MCKQKLYNQNYLNILAKLQCWNEPCSEVVRTVSPITPDKFNKWWPIRHYL